MLSKIFKTIKNFLKREEYYSGRGHSETISSLAFGRRHCEIEDAFAHTVDQTVILASPEFAMFVIARIYECTVPLHVPILGLIISFSLRGCKNLQLLSGPDGSGEKSVCDLQSMGGGRPGGREGSRWTTIFGAAIQSWEVAA